MKSQLTPKLSLPYLDVHGEPDRGLITGSQLFFNEASYARLRRLWISHEIAETVSRDVQNSPSIRDTANWEYF